MKEIAYYYRTCKLASASALLLAACGGSTPPAETASSDDASPPAAEAANAAPSADGAPSEAEPAASLEPAAVVAAPDRTEEDRKADARRKPVELLTFLGIAPGSRVADLGAGGGYTTELLVRSVGPEGKVYAQNNQMTLEKFVSESWPKRLQRDAMQGVVRMDREYEDPFAPEAKDLDLVTLMFSYHDVIAQGGDRAQLNAKVFDALKSGGTYVIADHHAIEGSGLEAATKVHRIDPSIVREEVEAAGFEFVDSADFLKDDSDDKTQPSFSVGFNTDRFVLRFKKP